MKIAELFPLKVYPFTLKKTIFVVSVGMGEMEVRERLPGYVLFCDHG